MTTAKQAEEYVKHYFKKELDIDLVKAGRGELGFDFRDESSKLFVEVKGSTKDLKGILFRYFTNTEYEKARSCRREGTKYEIHLVAGIGSELPEHYVIPGEVLLDQAKPEVNWYLPVRKDFRKYKL